MRKIILASASPQRRKLMAVLGLPFTIRAPSTLKEITRSNAGCAALVKANAFLKAKDIASRVTSGLVVGVDTVVCSARGRLIFKPKDLKAAKADLKELMARPRKGAWPQRGFTPHWVHSGVAIVDAATGKTAVGHEKTRVFMDRLSGKAIDRYHRLVSPLDKAGGFDIEGKGALFIPRIEGCYFNVVGLPLARLRKMLEKFGVHVL
ncbi:MAG: septum formation protein Maf [Candidatus Omnitrophica bacterium]|nr:septum formation protein Maf [Candidatus Omnitrophota bacterium]